MAEHLHDSVLQTLALIQRAANDPHQVQRLARAQERELRSWLFDESQRARWGSKSRLRSRKRWPAFNKMSRASTA